MSVPENVIHILYFQALRNSLGTPGEDVAWRDGDTVGSVLDRLKVGRPQLVPWMGSLMIALNEEWCDRRSSIKPGDTLALMPPVSGG